MNTVSFPHTNGYSYDRNNSFQLEAFPIVKEETTWFIANVGYFKKIIYEDYYRTLKEELFFFLSERVYLTISLHFLVC